MEDAIVLYPSPGIGKLIPMVKLGKLIAILLSHHPRFSITILITTPPKPSNISTVSVIEQAIHSVSQYIAAVSATNPFITFHHLPLFSDPNFLSSDLYHNPLQMGFEFPLHNNPNLHYALLSISRNYAFLIDFFCDAAAKLHIPTYYFFNSGACEVLALFLNIPTVDPSTGDLKLSDISHRYPRLTVHSFFFMARNFARPHHQSLKELLQDRNHMPEGTRTLPVFCMRPLISTTKNESGEGHKKCLNWLDKQPKQGAVFPCFGPISLFSSKRLKEIAIALEKGERRILWVVRNPPADNHNSYRTRTLV